MNKQDIDQSETSWLIYSDYLEENNQLNLAEQIRFELDYKPINYPPPYSGVGSSRVGGCIGVRGGSSVGSVGGYSNDYVGSVFGSIGSGVGSVFGSIGSGGRSWE